MARQAVPLWIAEMDAAAEKQQPLLLQEIRELWELWELSKDTHITLTSREATLLLHAALLAINSGAVKRETGEAYDAGQRERFGGDEPNHSASRGRT